MGGFGLLGLAAPTLAPPTIAAATARSLPPEAARAVPRIELQADALSVAARRALRDAPSP